MRRPIKTAMSSKTGQVPSTYKRATQAQGALGDTILFHLLLATFMSGGLLKSTWASLSAYGSRSMMFPSSFGFPLLVQEHIERHNLANGGRQETQLGLVRPCPLQTAQLAGSGSWQCTEHPCRCLPAIFHSSSTIHGRA